MRQVHRCGGGKGWAGGTCAPRIGSLLLWRKVRWEGQRREDGEGKTGWERWGGLAKAVRLISQREETLPRP